MVFRQVQYIFTRLRYANKKLGDKNFFLVDITLNSMEDMIEKLKIFKGKTELHFY